MNIIKEIDILLGKINKETGETNSEFELNIWTDKEKSHNIKRRLIKDAEKYGIDVVENFDNEHWISVQIGNLDISIWHNSI